MSTTANQIIPIQVSITANGSASDLARGVRVVRQSDGTCVLAGAAQRGDYITLQVIKAGTIGLAAPIACGGQIPVYTNVATNVADLCYTAANGAHTNVSTNAVLMGRFIDAGAQSSLAAIETFSVA